MGVSNKEVYNTKFKDAISSRIARAHWDRRRTMRVGEPSPASESNTEVLSPDEAEYTTGLGDALTSHMHCASTIMEKKSELKDIKGHIVYFPLNFLANEPLEPRLYPSELFQ